MGNFIFPVYLRTTPDVVYERIRKRARSEETCVPFEYIKQLHELHEDWLIRKKVGCNIKVNTNIIQSFY